MGGNLSNGRESAKPASRRRQSKADDRVDKLIGMVDQLIGMLEKEQAARAGDLARERMEHQIKAARWELHFCVRTVLEAMLRCADSASASVGGAMFKQFIRDHLVDQTQPHKLSADAQQRYLLIRNTQPFVGQPRVADPGFVSSLIHMYGRLNEQSHTFPRIEQSAHQTGVVCGGPVAQAVQQVFMIASIQKFCMDNKLTLSPSGLNDVAVLSNEYDAVVGRVTNGVYISATSPVGSSVALDSS
jgi:hypothetical protein